MRWLAGWWSRGLGLASLVMVQGCGPTAGLLRPGTADDAGVGATGGPSDDDDDDDDAPDDGDASDDGDAPDDTGDGDTADTADTDDDVPAGLCGVPLDEGLAVLLRVDTAELVHGDGSTLPLATLSSGPSDAAPSAAASIGKHHLAVVLSWLQVGNSPPARGYELHVFDRAGALQWTHTEGNASVYSSLVADDGSVWGTRSTGPGDDHGASWSGPFAPAVYPEYTPLGIPDDAGLVPSRQVLDPDTGAWTLGWFDPQTGAFVPVEGMSSTWYRARDGGFVFRSGDALVWQSPRQRTMLVALGEHAGLEPTYGGTHDTGDWLLLSNSERTEWARVDLGGGTVESLELDAPGAMVPMSCYGIEASIDGQGRVLVPSRDASTAEVLRHQPEDGSWEAVGLPVTNIDALHATPHGDAVLIRADGPGTTFCPPPAFDPAPGVLTGAQTMLDLPELEAPVVVSEEQWLLGLRADGRCFALGDAAGATIVDPVSGESLGLGTDVGVVFVP